MNSAEVMARYGARLILAGTAAGCPLVDTADRRDDNVVSIDAHRTRKATIAYWRSRGF